MKSTYKQAIVAATILFGVAFFSWYFKVSSYFQLAVVQKKTETLHDLVIKYPVISVLMYVAGFTLLVAGTAPVVPPLALLGGYLFGVVPGLLYALFCSVVGSGISFLLVRYVLRGFVMHRYKEQLDRFHEKIRSKGVYRYLITLQLVTVVPFFVINTLAALADVPLSTFLWTTAIGSFPVLCIYVFAGKQISTINSFRDLFSIHVILLLLLCIVLLFLPVIVSAYRRRNRA